MITFYGYSQTYMRIDSVSFIHFHKTDSSLKELSFGAAGSVSRSLYFNENIGLSSQTPLFFDPLVDLPSFDVSKPIVDVDYFLGPNQEQFFSVFHTQNIKQGINYAVHYLKKNYDGYYQNQATNHNFFQLNFTYHPSSSIYSAKIFYKYHRYFHEQNGGIQNDSSFTEDVFFSRNRMLMDVSLPDAFSKDLLHKIGVNQELTLANKQDSLGLKKEQLLNLELSYSYQLRSYFDSISDDYDWLSFIDTSATYDTLSKNNIQGNLFYTYNKLKDSLKSSQLKLGVSFNLIDHKNVNIDTSYYNLCLRSNYKFKHKKAQFDLGASYFLIGYRAEDYFINGGITSFHKDLKFNIQAKYENVTPAFELLRYYGNHSYWVNSFTDQKILNLSGSLLFNEWNVSTHYTDIFNPIFFNYLGVPEQYDGVAQIIQSYIRKKINFNSWTLHPSICYQYHGGVDVYRLPEWVGILDVSYNIDAFKSALKMSVGVQTKLFSEFNLMNYAPDIGQFYLSDDKLQNKYAMVDFYLNAKIQRVKFSFSLTHANAGLMGFNYFSALHYPFPDRYFKMGLSWMFLN